MIQFLATPAARSRAIAPALAAVALAAFLAGCASPGTVAPPAQLLEPAQVGLAAETASPAPTLAADWWHTLGDAQLSALVDRALAGHPSLQAAQARIGRAEAVLAAARGVDGPQAGASADATRERFSAHSIYPPPLGGSIRTIANLQLAGSWEIDFFGRNRAAIEAAVGTTRAAQADVQAARNLLASQVARSYVQLARLQAQRAVGEQLLRQRQASLALVQQRVAAGLDTALERRQAEAAPPETQQQIQALDEQIGTLRHALAALSVQPPDALATLQAPLAALDLPLPEQLPADLLGRRADIEAARWRVQAAGSDVQSARAQFYPNISLNAFVGLASLGLDKLVRSGSEQYGAGPALRLPILDGGRLRANLQGKAAELDAAVASYNATLLEAVHEVADPLAALPLLARQQAEQAQAQAAADALAQVARERYVAGLTGYQAVLNAEAGMLAQQRLAIDLRARVLDTQFALVRALGGGYAAERPAATAAATR